MSFRNDISLIRKWSKGGAKPVSGGFIKHDVFSRIKEVVNYLPPTITNPHPEVTHRTADRIERREITLVGAQGPIPTAYGRQRLGGQVLYFFVNGNDFWYVVGLCRGEDARFTSGPCDSLVQTTLNGNTFGGANIYWHDGAITQTVDANLAAVDASWNEDLIVRDPATGLKLFGISYAVVQLVNISKNWPEMPNFVFEQKCRRVLDPRASVIAYSENLVLQGYDFLRDPEGKNLSTTRINTAAINTAANTADETLGSGKRYAGHLLMMDSTSSDDWLKTWIILVDGIWTFSQNQWFLILDRPATSVATYDDSYATEAEPHGYREDPNQRINEVVIEWTDVTNNWTVTPSRLATDNVKNGIEDRRTATYKLPWLHDYSIVQTKLTYLLNRHQYDFKLERQHTSATADRQVGDVITETVTSRAISSQMFRVVDRQKNPDGTFDDVLLEYQAACYGDTVASVGSKINSTIPDVASPPPDVTGFTSSSITEELYQPQLGQYEPRARLTWTNPTSYPWFEAVELYLSINGGEFRLFDEYTSAPAMVDAIMELAPYTFKLVVRNIFKNRSAGVSVTKTFAGKINPPSDVPSLVGGSNDQQVFLSWQPATDLDLFYYEVRRGTTSDTWSTAAYIGKSQQLFFRDTPPNSNVTLRYFVKAVDSGQRYSVNAATFDIAMTFVGQAPSESSSAFYPNITAFPSSTGSEFYGLRKGSGNLIAEMNYDVVAGKQINNILLSRLSSPAAAESERAAGGYTVGGWATNIDDPRRAGAPIWAPLPAAAQGEIWGDQGNPGRLRETRFRLAKVSHSPVVNDTPSNVSEVSTFVIPDYNFPAVGKQYGSTYTATPEGKVRAVGVRMSTNSPTYQQVLSSDANGILYFSSAAVRPYTFASGVATTDGSGRTSISIATYLNYINTSGSQLWLTIRAVPKNAAGKVIVIETIDTSFGQSITFKSFNATDGSVATGVTFGYELVDNGGTLAVIAW